MKRLVAKGKSEIGYIVSPSGSKGGGMGRVKDYILQSGGDRWGRVRFVALDSRGGGSALWSIPRTFAALFRIWFSALNNKAAFVHVNMAERGSVLRKGLLIYFVRLIGVPVVLHLHAAELVQLYQEGSRFQRWLTRQPFLRASCCVVLGKIWRDWLIDELGVEPQKIEILYNGVPVNFIAKADNAFTPDKACQILFLGNLVERKGLSDFLHALALLPKETGEWHATMVGDGNIPHYQKLAKNLGIAARVNFTGWVEQDHVRQMLRDADISVLPSYNEGLPLSILEALGCGTPVVATTVGAIPEVLEDGRNALFVEPGNRAGIAKALHRLIQDPALRKHLSEEGLALYRDRFTLERFLENLFGIYRRHCGIEIENKSLKLTD